MVKTRHRGNLQNGSTCMSLVGCGDETITVIYAKY